MFMDIFLYVYLQNKAYILLYVQDSSVTNVMFVSLPDKAFSCCSTQAMSSCMCFFGFTQDHINVVLH